MHAACFVFLLFGLIDGLSKYSCHCHFYVTVSRWGATYFGHDRIWPTAFHTLATTYFGHDPLWPRPVLATVSPTLATVNFGHFRGWGGGGGPNTEKVWGPKGGGPKGWGPEGWGRNGGTRKGGGPNPEKGWGTKGGGPQGWGPEGWGAKFLCFFSFSRIFILVSSLWRSSRGISAFWSVGTSFVLVFALVVLWKQAPAGEGGPAEGGPTS